MLIIGVIYLMHVGDCKTLGSQQYVVDEGNDSSGGFLDEIIVSVNSDGTPSAFSSDGTLSCVVNAGCFSPQQGFRPVVLDILSDKTLSYDPRICFTLCLSLKLKVSAVNGPHCACSAALTPFFVFAASESSCDIACTTTDFKSSICGGTADFWNIFMCYTFEQINSLVVDPWRNVAFKSVSINWYREDGVSYSSNSTFPTQTYYLFAHDVSSGASLLQYHVKQSGGTYTGLAFDVDSSRIVGLMLSSNESFTYRLLTIDIDTSDLKRPNMILKLWPMFTSTAADIFVAGGPEADASNFFMANKISGLVSRNGLDTYVFASTYGIIGNDPATAKSKLIFVELTSNVIGRVFHTAPLDCVVTQLAINEFYGDVAILAPRQGAIQFIAIATVYRDSRTGSLAVHSYWDPSGLNPVFVAAVQDTQSLNLIAGVTASIPLANQSCHGIMLYSSVNGAVKYTDDRQLLLNQPVSPSDVHNNSVPSVVCFDIRNQGFFQLWGSYNGTARTVDNGTINAAITMDLYQQDPGFPMTLARPEIVSCELSNSGLAVSVKFDSVTLMGATAIDTFNTGIPDSVDLSTQVLLPESAATCFANSSLPLLTGATCNFVAPDLLLLSLDRRMSLLTFGNALCIKPNFLWRHAGNEWSTSASGCCTVKIPANLAAPKPVLVVKPALTIDVCSDISLDLTDSINCGRGCLFTWQLLDIRDIANVTGTGQLTYGTDILMQYRNGINEMLLSPGNNITKFSIPSVMLAKNAYHYFSVLLISSWQKTFLTQFVVIKLGESAPTVAIQGDARLVKTQASDYTLTAVGRASSCSTGNSIAIGYTWTYMNCSVALTNVIANQNSLHIAPNTHVCSPTAGWFDPTINQVVCEQCVASVSVYLANAPQKFSTQSVSVVIVKSPILAQCYNPDFALVTRGPVFFVNCANSIDLDYPQSLTFQANFDFACQTSSLLPCFPTSMLSNMPTCVTDYTQSRIVGDGGILYPQVLFNATQGFCRMGRGITAINTNLLSIGTFSIQVNVSDTFRISSKSISIQLTDLPMPKLSLAVLAPVTGKYPISASMQLSGTSSLDASSTVNNVIVFAWSLFAQQLNPNYDQDLAASAASKGQLYTVPKYVYKLTTTLDTCRAAGTASWTSTSPTIAILPYCLSASTAYTVRLNMTWTQTINGNSVPLSTFSELIFSTASGPPKNGLFTVEPTDPDFATCDYPKTLYASDWVSDETPLSYRFGYIVNSTASAVVTKYWFQDVSQGIRSFIGLVPCGVIASDFSRTLFVQIASSSGESVFAFLQIRSYPPPDPIPAAQAIIVTADATYDSNPSDAFHEYMTAISLTTGTSAADQTMLMNQIVASVGQTVCSSSDCGDRQLVFLNTLAAVVTTTGSSISPEVQETILIAIEANTARIIASGIVSSAKSQTIFSSIATLLGAFVSFPTGFTDPVVLAAKRKLFARPSPTAVAPGRVLTAIAVDATPIVSSCDVAHCDHPGVICFKPVAQMRRESEHHIFLCCPTSNPDTDCFDPPCWFLRHSCPAQSRRLAESVDSSFDGLILSARAEEEGPLADTIALQREADIAALDEQRAVAAEEAYLSSLSADVQALLRAQWDASIAEGWAIANATALNASAQLARIVAARDAIAKAIIKTLIRNQDPLLFETDQFRVYIGKATDMSVVMPQFRFPSQYTVPSNSPDYPTADNPVTGFSFIYVEYFANVFAWSLNAPISSQSTIASISIMRANPDLPLVISPSTDPIRIFADRNLHSSIKCLLWDRLAPFSGGGWTVHESINDGNGCLLSQPGDVGLFIDGAVVDQNNTKPLGPSPPKEVYSKYNSPRYLIVAMGGCFLLIVLLLSLWALRSDLMQTAPPVVYDGDGIATPLSVNDPIAYSQRDEGITLFILATFWNTIKIKHVLLSLIFQCDVMYTRFHRILVASSMILSVLLFASILSSSTSNPGSLGFTASLLSYPIYFLFQFVFRARLVEPGPKPEHQVPLVDMPEGPFPGLQPPLPAITNIAHSPFAPLALAIPSGPPSARSAGVTPPPPLEDAPAFIKRIRDVYESKVMQEKAKELLYRNRQKIVPHWAITVSTILCFAMYLGFLILASVIVTVSSMEYDSRLEAVWFIAVIVGVVCDFCVLDILNCLITSLVEIRNHQIRRRQTSSSTVRKVLPPPPPRPVPFAPLSSRSSTSLAPPPTPYIRDEQDITLGTGLGAMMPVFVSQPPTPVSARSGPLLPGRMTPATPSHTPPPPPPPPPPPM